MYQLAKNLLGRGVDALRKSNRRERKPFQQEIQRKRVEVKAPGIVPRQSVNQPMQTGLEAMADSLIPIAEDKEN